MRTGSATRPTSWDRAVARRLLPRHREGGDGLACQGLLPRGTGRGRWRDHRGDVARQRWAWTSSTSAWGGAATLGPAVGVRLRLTLRRTPTATIIVVASAGNSGLFRQDLEPLGQRQMGDLGRGRRQSADDKLPEMASYSLVGPDKVKRFRSSPISRGSAAKSSRCSIRRACTCSACSRPSPRTRPTLRLIWRAARPDVGDVDGQPRVAAAALLVRSP